MAREHQQRETVEAAEQATTDPAVIASAASVMLSWYFFFVKGDRQRGIFVGLWPPTFLAFASYLEQKRMSERMNRAVGRRLMDRIEGVMQSQ